MDISGIIAAWILAMNLLFAQGYKYDYERNEVVPPARALPTKQRLRYHEA